MAVNTKRVVGRRTLRFATLDDVVCDAERLAGMPHRQLGNYTLGQICAHLAQPMGYCLDGFPVRAPWLLRTLGPLMKKRVITQPMSPGIRMPARFQAIFTPPDASTQEGLAALRDAVARLKSEPKRHPSPVFGTLTREEWDQFHCRHAELHLSFIVPQ